jgi:hypothetical protein
VVAVVAVGCDGRQWWWWWESGVGGGVEVGRVEEARGDAEAVCVADT